MKVPFSVYDFFAYLATGFLLLAATDYAFDGGWLLQEEPPPGLIAFGTIAAYMSGHIVATLSSYFLEHKFLRGVLISPEETLFQPQRKGCWPKLFPIFYKPFPPETQQRVMEKAASAGITKPGRGLFFHAHSIAKRDKATLDRLNVFLNLYGFCRNASMAAVLSVPILLYGGVKDVHWREWDGFEISKFLWALIAAVVAVGMFYRYLKFFKHYTEETFRTYAETPLETVPKQSGDK